MTRDSLIRRQQATASAEATNGEEGEQARTPKPMSKRIVAQDKPSPSTTRFLDIAAPGAPWSPANVDQGPSFGSAQWNKEVLAEAARRQRVHMERENLLMEEQLLHLRQQVEGRPTSGQQTVRQLRDNPAWREIVAAYRKCGVRPKQIAVANKLGFANEQPLRNRLRQLGITDWRNVHALVAAK